MRRSPAVVLACACTLLVAATGSAGAQDERFVEIDRVVAVVGTVPIPLSRVNEELNVVLSEMQRLGQAAPTDSAETIELQRELLDRLIDDELLVQLALRDTLVQVTDEQVRAAVETALRQTRSQFSSEFEYRRQLELAGLGTPEEYRRYMTEQTRRQMQKLNLIQSLRDRGDLRQVPPTEAEMQRYFEETRDQQPKRPASVTFRQIIIQPEASPEAEAEARARADSVLAELRNGADFATAARRFSDDSTTREQGGELGWFRRGRMVREFERIAFRLRPGQISNLVRTPFGFHIIQVQRVEPAEVQARHILFTPVITEANTAAARALGDSIAVALRAGASWDSLADLHHDPIEQSLFEDVALADLFPSYAGALADEQPGAIIGPVLLTEAGRERYAVIRFIERHAEGGYAFEELRDRIRQNLAEGSGVRRLVRELRESTYIDIRLR
ncbi:MAG: peptidylprolyl isomerase [Gemmatimonadales bacterium]